MRRRGRLVLAGVSVAGIVSVLYLLLDEPRIGEPLAETGHGEPASLRTALVEAEHVDRDAIRTLAHEPARSSTQAPPNRTPWTLRGRALDAKLVPLSDTTLEGGLFRIAIEPSGRERTLENESRIQATTDALGRFRSRVFLPKPPEAAIRELMLKVYDRASQLEWRGFVRVDLDRPTEVDIGDVVLAPAPTIFAGTVVDPSGAPLKYVYVWGEDPEDPTRAEDERMGRAAEIRYTNPDGRFSVPSWSRSTRLTVCSGDRDHATTRIPDVPVPSLDLRIVVPPAETASLRFTILTDDEHCGRRLCGRLRMARDGETPVRELRRSEHDYERKDQVFRPLDPGDYDLEIFDPSTGLVLARIGGLHVVEHAECDDDRVHPIDLRGRFICAKVLLVSDKGRPLGWDKLHVEGPDGRNELVADRDGWVYFAAPPDGPTLLAIGSGGEKTPLVDGASIVARSE